MNESQDINQIKSADCEYLEMKSATTTKYLDFIIHQKSDFKLFVV